MKIRTALLASAMALLATPAIADNHDTGNDVPYCGDTDSIAEPSPACIARDGDNPAQPDLGPWQDTDQFPGMNVIVLQPDEHMPGATLLKLSRVLFGEGEAIAIRQAVRHEPEIVEECDTHFCDGGTPARWCEEWWCRHHDAAPGQDEDRPSRDVAERPDRPERSEPPARPEPPRADPPRCD